MKQKSLLRTIIQDSTENKPDSLDYFKGIFPLYLHKKLRRLAEAIYLVTNHLSEHEPLKNKIRGEAVKVISLSVKIKGDDKDDISNVLYVEIVSSIASIISFLEVLAIAGIISESNHYLINKELNLIFANLRSKLDDQFNGQLPPLFFKVDIKELNQSENIQKDKYVTDNIESIKTNIKDNVQKISNLKEIKINRYSEKDSNDKNNSKKILRTVDKLDREKMILNFFKDNRKMTIKDIVVLLPQYSEKTIQREILRLVSNGNLSKSGKKRWTLYFIPLN